MRAIGDYQWAAGVQVTLRALWARVSVPVPKPPFKVKKLCIQIRKPQFDPLWVYASVPLLVGQNMGEMEGREGKCIKAWPNLFFFFFLIGSKMVLRLFLFLYPHSPTLLHTEKHTMPEHSAQPEAVWQHSITTKPHPNKKKKHQKNQTKNPTQQKIYLQPNKHQSTKVVGVEKQSCCKHIDSGTGFE